MSNRYTDKRAVGRPKKDNIHIGIGNLPDAIVELLGVEDSGTVVITRDNHSPTNLAILCTVMPSEFMIESQPDEVVIIYNELNGTNVPIQAVVKKRKRGNSRWQS